MIAVGRHREIVAKVDVIGQEHICEGTLIPVIAKGLEHNFFFKTKADAACFARVPNAWPFSEQSMPLSRMRSVWCPANEPAPFSPVSTSFHTFTLLPDLRGWDTLGTHGTNRPAMIS